MSETCVHSDFLTELFRPFNVLCDVGFAHGGPDAAQSRHKVVHRDRWADKLGRINLHKVHVLALGIRRIGWCEATFDPLESGRCLAPSNRHHQGFIDNNGEIGARVALRLVAESDPVVVSQTVLGLRPSVLQDARASSRIGKRNVDSLLETTSHGLIEFPRDVSGSEHKDTVHVVAHALHLNEELCFHSSRCVILTFATGSTQRVNLIYEDDGGFAVPRHLKELLNKSFRLTHPLGDQICRGDRKERAFALGGTGLRKEGLACSGWPVEQDASPRLANLIEKLRELDWQNNGFFEPLLGTF